MVRNQLRRQQQQLLEQQAVNNAVVSQQLRRQGLRQAGLGGVVGVVRPVGGVVGGVVGGDYGLGVGATAGLTGLPACCLRTDQTACLAVSPLSSYAVGSTCQRWYYDSLNRRCREATFNTVCADGRGFSNYFKSEALCYAKCGAGALAREGDGLDRRDLRGQRDREAALGLRRLPLERRARAARARRLLELLVPRHAGLEVVAALRGDHVLHAHVEVLVDDAAVDLLGHADADRALGDVVDLARAAVVVLEGHALDLGRVALDVDVVAQRVLGHVRRHLDHAPLAEGPREHVARARAAAERVP